MRRRLLVLMGVCLSLWGSCILQAQTNTSEKKSLSLENVKFKSFLSEMEGLYDCIFTYPSELIQKQKNISINFKNLNLDQALEIVLRDRGLKYKRKGNHVILSSKQVRKKHRISGIIKEKNSGETLIGAAIYNAETRVGTTSNAFGFFSLALEEGKQIIEVSYVGYAAFRKELNISADMSFNIELEPESQSLEEVVVRARAADANITEVKMSREKVKISTIKSMPAFMGETDVLKSLQMLPGVQSSGDATANLNVRGGSYDQNLILLDDAPIYNPSHALGFFSVFNADAIKNVEVYKGALPAQFGDRLSSVVDIRMKDGNLNEYHGSASIGTIASKLSFEGPIQKGKSSFIISGRYSYAGEVADNFSSAAKEIGLFKSQLNNYSEGNKVSFYDLNAKLNLHVNDKNRIYFSAYGGRDNFHFKLIDEKSSMDWGNITSTLRWNKIWGKRLFSNTSAVFSNFDYSYYILDDVRDFEWSSDLQEISLKQDFDFYAHANHHLKFGLAVNYHHVNPGEIAPRTATSITKARKLQDNYGLETSLYIGNEHKLSDRISMEYGLRLSSFAPFGEATVYNYADASKTKLQDSTKYKSGEFHDLMMGLEPRWSMRYQLSSQASVKASYARTRQYMHLLSTSSIGLPTDVWYTSGKHIKPQIADQIALGYFRNFKNNTYESSVELYYKDMQNQIDFKDNADLFLNPQVEQEIKSGKGWAYGAEFMFKKQKGKLNGWFSYTWAKTERKIEGINAGKAYPTRFDKRHDLSVMLSYQLTKRISLSSNFTYSTGAAITAPIGSFSFQGITANRYSERNGYRLPDYHRLDLSLIVDSKKRQNWNGQWVFSVYNAYSRHNAFSVYAKAADYDVSSSEAHMIYMFGMVPSISYRINF